MSSDPDDAALTWGDEPDSTHVDASSGQDEATKAGRPTTTRRGSEDLAAAVVRPATSSALLVVYGIFGGAYVLYAVGWIFAVQRSTVTLPTLFGDIMYQFGEFLAIASPAIWMGAVLFLTRGHKPVMRLLWLVVGLLLVAPWPFILRLAS